jgi:hypothetical protein
VHYEANRRIPFITESVNKNKGVNFRMSRNFKFLWGRNIMHEEAV